MEITPKGATKRTKPKSSTRKEIIKMGAEINDTATKKTIGKQQKYGENLLKTPLKVLAFVEGNKGLGAGAWSLSEN